MRDAEVDSRWRAGTERWNMEHGFCIFLFLDRGFRNRIVRRAFFVKMEMPISLMTSSKGHSRPSPRSVTALCVEERSNGSQDTRVTTFPGWLRSGGWAISARLRYGR